MDVMIGSIERIVSPPPHIARWASLDLAKRVRNAQWQAPDASPDELTRVIRQWGIPVSGIWVARIVQREAGQKVELAPGDGQFVAA